MLTKSQLVLDRQAGIAEDKFMCFDQEPGPVSGLHVDVPKETWDDMGSPDRITVTIEPGDRLND